MDKDPKLPFGSLPGDTEALLAAFDSMPPEKQKTVLGAIETTTTDEIPGIDVQLVAQGIMRAKELDRIAALREAMILIEQSLTIPAIKGVVAMLMEQGRLGSVKDNEYDV